MKKRTVIEYTEEPTDAGWKFNPRAKPLDASALAALGVAPPAPGSSYKRTERAGGVTVTRGGKRPGAGRKPAGHVRIQLSVSVETRKKLEALAKETGSLSSAAEKAIMAM